MLSGPPVPCVDGKVAYVPIGVIKNKILDMTDLAIAGVDMIARDLGDAAEMQIRLIRRSCGGGGLIGGRAPTRGGGEKGVAIAPRPK